MNTLPFDSHFQSKHPWKHKNWRDVEKVIEQGINKCFESIEIKLKDFNMRHMNGVVGEPMPSRTTSCLNYGFDVHIYIYIYIYIYICIYMCVCVWLDWLIYDAWSLSGNNSNQRSICFHFCIHKSLRRWTGSHLTVATGQGPSGISATPHLSLPQDWDWCNPSSTSSWIPPIFQAYFT
jgi:hypothetical protein